MKINPAFWAKKKIIEDEYYWLPLAQHLEDTRNIIGLLWDHWLSEGQRKFIEDSLSYQKEELGKNFVTFLGAIHDIGKATPAFQILRNRQNGYDALDAYLLNNLEKVGFTGISRLELQSARRSNHSLAGQFILNQFGLADDVATIIGGHHGKPINDKSECDNQMAYEANYYQTENRESELYRKWQHEQSAILKWALSTGDFQSVDDIPTIKQPAQVILSGLLIMADWIASNEHYFPLLPMESFVVSDNDKRYATGFQKWRNNNTQWINNRIVDVEELYLERFGFLPHDFQRKVFETVENSEDAQIFIIEAPMGLGKTEAALITAEQLAHKTGRGGIFFGLPTQATSNGMFPRIVDWVNKLEVDADDKFSLRLSHGKAALNDTFTKLASGLNIDGSDKTNDENISINAWFSGRKTSALDDFVVGTVDQFLMLSLKQRHLALRHLGFNKKVVIIDEVHAYDAYMSQFLKESVTWLGAYGVPVIILSATLPQDKRIELMESYRIGSGEKISKEKKVEQRNKMSIDAYPLITYNEGSDIKTFSDFDVEKSKEIKIIRKSEEELIEWVAELIRDGGIIGIIVNTVKKAQMLARELSEIYSDEMVELLHSRFIATERVCKENQLLSMIGKNAKRPTQRIIIGTQVIEQSLDIDFDVMISELAPMDLLIQRMGRLHRHEIKRPDVHKVAKFYVVGCDETFTFDKGNSYVYGDYLLARTQYYLPESLFIPNDISKLVQKVYTFNFENDDKDMSLENALVEKYKAFKNKHVTNLDKKENKAKTYKLANPVHKKTRRLTEDLIGWLSYDVINQSEAKAIARVRDINDTIEIIAVKQKGQGYTLFGSDIDISTKTDEISIAKEIAKQTVVLPNIFSKVYNIEDTIDELERYNLKNLSHWQNSNWLKGTLGIIFNEKNEFILSGKTIKYDERYGISVEEE